MGPFESFYASPVQHPVLLWLAALAAFAYCATRKDLPADVLRYCAALTALSLADAWLTSSHVYGLGTLSGRAASAVPLFFVLAGDCRYLLLAESATARGRIEIGARSLARAAGLTVIVPIASQAVVWLLPDSLASTRMLFFVYEVLFMALVGVLWRFHPRVRALPWLRQVSRFVLLYYGLWAAADTVILATGSDLGFGLRVIPNLLYYGGLIAAIAAAAPRAPAPAALP